MSLFILCILFQIPPAPAAENIVLNLTPGEGRFIAAQHPLVFSEVDWPPLSIVDGPDDFDGLIADYFKLISQRSGLTFKFIKSPTWADVLFNYKNQAIDIVPALGRDDDVGREILISDPFVKFPLVIVTRSHVSYITDTAQLNGRKVAVGRGYTSYHFLKQNYPGIQLIQTEDVRRGLISLANRDVFAVVGHMAVVITAVREMGLSDLKIAGETGYVFEHCMGVDPRYPQALSIINKVLASMTRADHRAIYDKWINIEYRPGTNYTLVLGILGGAAVILGIFAYWNRKLTVEVAEHKRTENRLKASEKEAKAAGEAIQAIRTELQQIFDNTQVGILFLRDREGIYRCNAAAAGILGYESPKELVDVRLRALHLSRGSFKGFGKKFYAALSRGAQVRTDFRLRRKDGNALWCSLSGKALDPGDTPDLTRGVIWVIDDISEKRRAIRGFKQNYRELERFHRVTVGREERMIQLKKEINELRVSAGKKEKYIIR